MFLGTGKSLTLTCGSLTWFLDHKNLLIKELQESIDRKSIELKKTEEENASSTDWINGNFAAIKLKQQINELKRIQQLLKENEERIKELQQLHKNGPAIDVFRDFPKSEVDTNNYELDEIEVYGV